ncbi:MAG: ATP-binding protein, partial [Solirubrobacterales bacterium]
MNKRKPLSFRRLMRMSLMAQVAVIALVLAFAGWDALSTVQRSEEFKESSSDVLLMRSVQREFDRGRTALREYAYSGDVFKLGPFTNSRGEVLKVSADLGRHLDAGTRFRIASYISAITNFLSTTGEATVEFVRSGDQKAARNLLNDQATLRSLATINAEGGALQDRLLARQRAAERAVTNRQVVNVTLIGLSGLLVLGAGLAMMLWIRAQMMLPLDDLATASRKLGHGELSARVKPGGVSEIALAGSAFNQMADEVEQHVRQLQDMSAARSRFVSSVSHELRTPITSLRGYLELLAGGEAGELASDQMHYVRIAERNARQLDELINDLLTLSRIQSGRISLKPVPVDIRGLLRELKAEMMPIAIERQVDLVLVDTGDLIVSGDPLRLKQAFGNLIGNAIKYSPDQQTVVVRAFRIDHQVVVSVVDWGAGIPKDELPKIAEPFFRSSATQQIPGTGLGLAIAKQMIELHGGRLAVESEYGSGSTFNAYLPLRNDDAAPGELDRPGDPCAGPESATVGQAAAGHAADSGPAGDG